MDLVEEIKKRSSKWIKTKGGHYTNFYWQRGYGAFSIHQSRVGQVKRYIDNQHEHHRKKGYKAEYVAMLVENKVEYDERFLWD